jgi:hypothetical protein
MSRRHRTDILTFAAITFAVWPHGLNAEPPVSKPAEIERLAINGPTDRIQLLATSRTTEPETGRKFDTDATRTAKIAFADAAIARTDSTGGIIGLADGKTVVTVEHENTRKNYELTVTGVNAPREPNFEIDVQPILTRLGCNSGPCHGKQRGQNGFQLSLFGFDSDFDYHSVATEDRGRRVFPTSPEKSLLLMKGTAQAPHGGGKRIDPESPYFKTLHAWIASGMPHAPADAAKPVSVTTEPRQITLRPKQTHQLRVLANYSDGTVRDVTHLAAFSSSDSVTVAVDSDGLVASGPLPGEIAVSARFENLFASTEVTIPLPGSLPKDYFEKLPRYNKVDELVYGRLEKLGIGVSAPADDATFLRRVSLDIIGRLPTAEETQAFLADTCTEKRENLVDSLLERPEYADHWAMKWVDLLRPNPYRVGIKAVINLDAWIRSQFRENVPYDKFVHDILTASGSTFDVSPATIFRDRREPEEITTVVSQLFLGIRLDCAKCHHHPFEVWSQEDFYGLAAHFARIGRKGVGLSPPISGSEEVMFPGKAGRVEHPRTGVTVDAKPLFEWATGGETKPDSASSTPEPRKSEPAGDVDLRRTFADWVTAPENPYFGKVIANRIWADLMGRGIVDPVDDIRATNPASNPELLDWLAQDFRATGHDLKHLIRTITTSYVYGLSSQPVERNVGDNRLFSRHYRKRLRAETLLDAVCDVTGVPESFSGAPPGTRAAALWTFRTPNVFLDTFGRPDPNQDPPCERLSEGSVTQALHLMNAPVLQEKIQSDSGIAAQLAKSDAAPEKIVESLYLKCFARSPSEREREVALKLFRDEETRKPGSKARRTAVEDLLWALLNTAEFVIVN